MLMFFSFWFLQHKLEKPKPNKAVPRLFTPLHPNQNPQSAKCPHHERDLNICKRLNVQSNTSWPKPQFPKTSLTFYLNTSPAMCPTGAQQTCCKTRPSSPLSEWRHKFQPPLRLWGELRCAGRGWNLSSHFAFLSDFLAQVHIWKLTTDEPRRRQSSQNQETIAWTEAFMRPCTE